VFEQLNFRVNFNKADYSNISFSDEDKEVLRELGKQVAEIASRPRMDGNRKLWTKHNKLEKTRPLILCDPENGWNEIVRDEHIKCKNDVARHWECHLRKQIFWGNEMKDDYVVEPYFNLPHVYKEKQWGLSTLENFEYIKSYREDGGAFHIDAIMNSYDQLIDLTKPQININYELTNDLLDLAHEIFDGILEVRLNTVWFWSVGLTDDFAFLRGMENLMYDLYDEPEKVHELMKILLQGTMEKLDFLESNKLLSLNNDGTFVGSGGIGYTEELPRSGVNGQVTTKDMWGLAESQITVGVSPDMFEEFIFPYQKILMERFGLTCYACCESMNDRFDIVKSVQNLRRVSVSPWANKEIMSEKLKDKYIYSLKPSPSYIATSTINEELIRDDIRSALKTTRDNQVELVMKDNHTLGNNPNNIKRWVQIAREEIELL
jgi:hypothetical protein